MASSSCHDRHKVPTTVPASAAPGEERDWAALPGDILFAIFLRLGPREIMRGAERACTAWRRVAVCEPALRRRVDLTSVPARPAAPRRAMARAAVDRAAGQCQAYWGPCDRQLLLYLVERATSLKSIHLTHVDTYEIALPHYSNGTSQDLLESTCQACPRLKELRMSFSMNLVSNYFDTFLEGWFDDYLFGHHQKYEIPEMRELHSLELQGYKLTAAGLKAILVGFPVLEYLNVNGYNRITDEELRAKCAKLKNLTLF